MKTIAVLSILLLAFGASSQNWRDTLEMARSAYQKKDYQKAVKLYEKAQKGAPENVDLSDEMAQSAYKSGDYQKAESIYQQNQNSRSGKKSKVDNYHNLGNSRMKSENYEGAIEAYKDALRLNPNDQETRYNLSEAKRKLKKQQEKENQEGGDSGGDGDNGDNGGNSNPQQSNAGNQSQPGQDSQGQNSPQQKSGNNSSSSQQGNGGQRRNGQDKPQSGQGQLSNKTADRMIEDLMKREAETKRRITGGGAGGGASKSGKDW